MRPKRLQLAGFLLLAILTGWPDRGSVLAASLAGQSWVAQTASSLLAGLILGALALVRRVRWPDRQALGAIALVVLLPFSVSALGLHRSGSMLPAPGGIALLAGMAAPLWLAALSAMRVTEVQVPRAVAGAAIAAIAGASLILPGNAMTLTTTSQIPGTLLVVLAAVFTVWTWTYAAPRLKEGSALATAACACVILGLAHVVALVVERRGWHAVDLHAVWSPLVVNAVVFLAPTTWLWYWLLGRMALPAFSLLAIAAWFVPSVAGFALFGFSAWRVDFAVLLGLGALWTGLRARVEDDDPMSLGLG